MKTKIFNTIVILLCLTEIVNAQIKVFDGGNVTVGSTIKPSLGARLQVTGNTLFTESNLSIASAAYIRGMNSYSTASSPDYTWYNNSNTGTFHPAPGNTIGFSINEHEVMRLNSNLHVLIGHTDD